MSEVYPVMFIHCDDVYAVLNAQHAVRKHLLVRVFKNIPAGPTEAVLQLRDAPSGQVLTVLSGVYEGIKHSHKWSDRPECSSDLARVN